MWLDFYLPIIALIIIILVEQYLPENPPLIDDNSYPSLNGYQYFLLEPEVCTMLLQVLIPDFLAMSDIKGTVKLYFFC